jgi:hypothetical protein
MTELHHLPAGLAGSPSFSDEGEGEGSSFTEGVSVSPEVGVATPYRRSMYSPDDAVSDSM